MKMPSDLETLLKPYVGSSAHQLVVPVAVVEALPPILKWAVAEVQMAENHIYLADKFNQGWAFRYDGIKMLVAAANIDVLAVNSETPRICAECVKHRIPQCNQCEHQHDVRMSATVAMLDSSGVKREFSASKELDLSRMPAKTSDKEMAMLRLHGPQKAESLARSRAVLAALTLKGTYPKEEILKTFVIVKVVLNTDDAQVKDFLLQNLTGASGLLFGNRGAAVARIQTVKVDLPDDEAEPLTPESLAALMGGQPGVEARPEPSLASGQSGQELLCMECNQPIISTENGNAAEIAAFAREKFGRCLCPDCMRMADTIRCMEELARMAQMERPDAIVISGDLTHRARQMADPSLDEIVVLSGWFRSLTKVALVLDLMGTRNHDSQKVIANLQAMGIANLQLITEQDLLTVVTAYDCESNICPLGAELALCPFPTCFYRKT